MVSPVAEDLILYDLARRSHATADEIGQTHAMDSDLVAECLSALEKQGLVSGRQDPDSKAPRRVYSVTSEGRRKAGSADSR